MIVLDTTVLVYATGAEHRLREPCRRLVSAIAEGLIEATTTVEVVQEFVHVRGRRRPRADAAELGTAYADLLGPLLHVSAETLGAGLQLYRDHEHLGAFDAVLAAAVLSSQADAIVSADAAFSVVRGVTHVVPDEAGVARLLGASPRFSPGPDTPDTGSVLEDLRNDRE